MQQYSEAAAAARKEAGKSPQPNRRVTPSRLSSIGEEEEEGKCVPRNETRNSNVGLRKRKSQGTTRGGRGGGERRAEKRNNKCI